MSTIDPSSVRQRLDVAAVSTVDRGRTWREKLAPPATQAELSTVASILGWALPGDFEAFLRVANGAELTVKMSATEGGFEDVLRIWSTAQIEKFYHSYFANDPSLPLLIPFAECDADFLVFDMRSVAGSAYPVVFVAHDNAFTAYADEPIAWSFTDWFEKTFECLLGPRATFWYFYDGLV